MERAGTVLLTATLLATSWGGGPAASAQTLAGQQVAGAFVTMTEGAKCPSSMTVNFVAQAEATGSPAGIYDERGSFRLSVDPDRGAARIVAFSSAFAFNETAVTGELVWEPVDGQPLRVSCDPLFLRIEGELRYRVTQPFAESGIARIDASGSREAITRPYFGHSKVVFAAPRARR